MTNQTDKRRMHVLVTGGGAFGSYVARDLVDKGHEVTLLDEDSSVIAELKERLPNVRLVCGDACEPRILEEAGILRADVVVAATSDDEDNLVIALLSHKEFDVSRVVARVNDPRNGWLFTDWWGVDHALSAPDAFVPMVEEFVASAPQHPAEAPPETR